MKEGGYNNWWVILFSESSKVLITHGGLGGVMTMMGEEQWEGEIVWPVKADRKPS